MSRSFSRRTFLRGAGAAIALPMLESLWPRSSRAGNPKPPLRLMAFYVPCGINMAVWTPKIEGAGFDLPQILAPLAPLQDQVLVLTGLANRPAQPDGPGDHASGTGAFLTAAHPHKTDGADIENGISMDQAAAAFLAKGTSFPSLQLGMDGGSSAGGCDSGYSCAYARNISWASATEPLPKITDPLLLFDRLFGNADADLTPEQVAKRRREKRSVLDYAIGDATTLRPRLGTTDRRKLDEHLSSIRDLEMRVTTGIGDNQCAHGPRLTDTGDFPADLKIMLDLIAIALRCDLTRVITFMLGNAGSNRVYPNLGIADGHHSISHHMGDPTRLAQLATIDTFEVAQLAYLLQQLAANTESDGSTTLDNSLVFFSSEIEDGNSHAHVNLPVLLAGKAGGVIKPGRHIRYSQEVPIADLFTSMLSALGGTLMPFGLNGTGMPLPGLTG